MNQSIETSRLRLREPKINDFDAVWEMKNDPSTMTFTGGIIQESYNEAYEKFKKNCETFRENSDKVYSVALRETDEYIGYCGLKYCDILDGVEILYGISRKYWGNGYAKEAAQAVLDHGLKVEKIPEIVAAVNTENIASERILQRIGMNFAGKVEWPNQGLVNKYSVRLEAEMNIKMELMSLANIKDIFEFEVENKAFFEHTLPPRPAGYASYETFKAIMIELLEAQEKGERSMYLIRDHEGYMVGRVNLFFTLDENTKKAEIGYRIAEKAQGNGYASQAVVLATELGFETFDLQTIEAGTSTKNIGSQRVLEKNGFKRIGKEEKVMKVNDEWIDGFLYSKSK